MHSPLPQLPLSYTRGEGPDMGGAEEATWRSELQPCPGIGPTPGDGGPAPAPSDPCPGGWGTAGSITYSGLMLSEGLWYTVPPDIFIAALGGRQVICFTDKEMILRDGAFFRVEVKLRLEPCLPPPPPPSPGCCCAPRHLANHLKGKAVL